MANTDKIEEQLIIQCKSGNSLAQMQLYNKYSKAMYNVSARILKDPMKSEDAMQEAFIMAFKKLDDFRGEVTFGAWLKRIVVNKSIDLLKKREEQGLSLNEETYGEEVYEPAYSTNDEHYEIEHVHAQIMNLPSSDRTMISLYYLEGYDHEEIAEVLGISYANSRTKLSRALNKLKQLV